METYSRCRKRETDDEQRQCYLFIVPIPTSYILCECVTRIIIRITYELYLLYTIPRYINTTERGT